ncbi:MAG: LysR family transcriptional regulator [Pseudomonadota bacterium]
MHIENIADLRLLAETERQGSLTGASRVLGMTPAAASATLKRIERRLGLRLFERSTRAMRLTPEGATLLDYARRAMELLEEGEAQALSGSGAIAGTLRLAAPSDLTRSVLLPWLDDFLAAHPGVHLVLQATDRVQDVVRDAVDLALRYGTLADSRLVARRLADTRRVLCAAPAYLARHGVPRTPLELTGHNCLSFHIDSRRYVAWRFEREGVWTEVRVDGDRTTDDAAIAHQWALAGAGVIYKSRLDVAHDLRAGRLVPLLDGWRGESYPLNAVLPGSRFVPQRAKRLVDFLAARFAAEAAANPSP